MSIKKVLIFSFLIFCLVIIFLIKGNSFNYENPVVEHSNISCKKTYGLSFPPFSNLEGIDFTLKELKLLDLDRIRISIDWENREPKKGEFYWDPMDYRMRVAEENNISVLLTVHSNGPNWACSEKRNEKSCVYSNEQDFKKYITEILARYKIDKIQFGNEWENNYAGTMKEYVKYNNILYEQTKKNSPDTQVVLGGITESYPIIERYCNQNKDLDFSKIKFSNSYEKEKILSKLDNDLCKSEIIEKVLYVFDNAKYDMIDIHLYDDAENWETYIDILSKNKPIIVSEFGGPNSEFEKRNQTYQAQRIKKYLEVIEKLPIQEAYYFKLVDSPYSYHKDSGLYDINLIKKLAYWVFSSCTTSTSK